MHNSIQNAGSIVRRWACLVGVNEYIHIERSLRFCANDAREFRDLLVATPNSGYADDRITMLLSEVPGDAKSTRLSILTQLQEMADSAQPEDMLLFYFAGHGHYVEENVYLLAADTQSGVLLPETAVPLTSITKILDSSQAHSKVIILDACYTGVPLRYGIARRSLQGPDSETMEILLRESEGTAVLSSAARSDAAFEDEEMKHGVFTYYLLDGLRGAANRRPDGSITVNDIHKYVFDHVTQWAKQNGHSMRPTMEFRGSGELSLITLAIIEPSPDVLIPATVPPDLSFLSPASSPDTWLGPLRKPGKPWPGWVGRGTELERIKQHIFTTTDMAIRVKGEPGYGKTSLLYRVKHEIEADTSQLPRRFRCIFIPTGNLNSCEDFASEIWEGVVQCIDSERSQLVEDPFKKGGFGVFGAQLEKVQAIVPEITFIACLDDFDRVLVQCNELEQKRISGLISHLIDWTSFPIVFFFTLARDLPGHYLSPFTMNALSLHLFDEAETRALISKLLQGYVTPTDAESRWIFEYTGGHPYFTRLLVAKLFDLGPWAAPEKGVGQGRLEQAASAAIVSDRAYLLLAGVYGNLFDDGQRRILLQLACSGSRCISLHEIERKLRTSVTQLTRKQYLTESEDGLVSPRIRFVIDWLRHWDGFAAELDRLNIACEKLTETVVLDKPPVPRSPSNGICIDRRTQRVYVEGAEVTTPLTDLQYRALVFLVQKTGDVVSYDDIAKELWPNDFFDQEEGMDEQRIPTLISRLRLVLNDRQKPYKYLMTLPKRGYRLENATLL